MESVTLRRRREDAYEREQKPALDGMEPPPHSLIGVSAPAWSGMAVEVEVTAAIAL